MCVMTVLQSVFCPERRAGDKHGLPAALGVLSECAEATAAVLDARVCAALQRYHAHLHYLHLSDRYAGAKQQESVHSSHSDTYIQINHFLRKKTKSKSVYPFGNYVVTNTSKS